MDGRCNLEQPLNSPSGGVDQCVYVYVCERGSVCIVCISIRYLCLSLGEVYWVCYLDAAHCKGPGISVVEFAQVDPAIAKYCRKSGALWRGSDTSF